MKVDFIIDGAPVAAASGATFTRRDPVTGAVASEAAAASEADVAKVVEAARARLSRLVGDRPERAPRACLLKAADLLEARAAEFVAADDRGDRRDRAVGWASTVHLAAGLLREAAALTTQIAGEIIPSDKPGMPGAGGAPAGRRRARHRAVERAGHPRRARACRCRSPAATP